MTQCAFSMMDSAVSTLRRPALERLRDWLTSVGARNCISIPPIDWPQYAHQVVVVEELIELGVMIEFLNRAIGVSPEEDLLLQMQGMFAEYERAKIMERCRRGKKHAASRGMSACSVRRPYGYRYLSKVRVVVRPLMRSMSTGLGRQANLRVGWPRSDLDGRSDSSVESSGNSNGQRSCAVESFDCVENAEKPCYQGSATFGKTRVGVRRPQVKTVSRPVIDTTSEQFHLRDKAGRASRDSCSRNRFKRVVWTVQEQLKTTNCSLVSAKMAHESAPRTTGM